VNLTEAKCRNKNLRNYGTRSHLVSGLCPAPLFYFVTRYWLTINVRTVRLPMDNFQYVNVHTWY